MRISASERSQLTLDASVVVPEDPPAWWLLKKKKTMYHTGMVNARSLRSIMVFLLDPRNGPEVFEQEEKTFADIREFLLSLEPPDYPFAIEQEQVAKGKQLFQKNCSECHGTYGEDWEYPNRVVDIETIGTDPVRYNAYSKKFIDHYNASWFGEKHKMQPAAGYQAPPPDGIWATAPYLHNGSVPTVYHLLNSRTRPAVFTRSYRTGTDEYDSAKLGWRVTVLRDDGDERIEAIEKRKIYDTSRHGQGNAGHTFGDHLSDEQRYAIIEYLKTI